MSTQQTQAVLASLVELRGELASKVEATFDAANPVQSFEKLRAKVRAYPAIVRADALIAELSAGAV